MLVCFSRQNTIFQNRIQSHNRFRHQHRLYKKVFFSKNPEDIMLRIVYIYICILQTLLVL